jgi:hypothetical protein
MKWLIILFGIFFTLNVKAKESSYLGMDYYDVQDMIWECGDSITEIDYTKRVIYFCNRGSNILYTGKVLFDKDWISSGSETCYINYFKGYSVKSYLDGLKGLDGLVVKGNTYQIDGLIYYVSKKRGKLFITEK